MKKDLLYTKLLLENDIGLEILKDTIYDMSFRVYYKENCHIGYVSVRASKPSVIFASVEGKGSIRMYPDTNSNMVRFGNIEAAAMDVANHKIGNNGVPYYRG